MCVFVCVCVCVCVWVFLVGALTMSLRTPPSDSSSPSDSSALLAGTVPQVFTWSSILKNKSMGDMLFSCCLRLRKEHTNKLTAARLGRLRLHMGQTTASVCIRSRNLSDMRSSDISQNFAVGTTFRSICTYCRRFRPR